MTQNNQYYIDTTGLSCLERGTLRNGAPYEIVILDLANAQTSQNFHASMVDALDAGEKSYLLGKSPEYFENHCGPLGKIMAIVANNQIIAQAVIHQPTTQNPYTGMVDVGMPAPPYKTSILQAVTTDPAWRGHNLMLKLIKHWVYEAANDNRDYLLSEIDIENIASWNSFLRGGLNIVSIGHDKHDNSYVYNACEKTDVAVKRQLTPEFNRASRGPSVKCPLQDLIQQRALLQQGFVATKTDETKKNLVFKKLSL